MDSDGERSAGAGAKVTKVPVVGVVTETLPSSLYRVKVEGGGLVTAHIADRMDRNFVRLLVGDRVRLELSPVDGGRGRIVEKT